MYSHVNWCHGRVQRLQVAILQIQTPNLGFRASSLMGRGIFQDFSMKIFFQKKKLKNAQKRPKLQFFLTKKCNFYPIFDIFSILEQYGHWKILFFSRFSKKSFLAILGHF